jgi:Skp family chaperone for outer membrane proteins
MLAGGGASDLTRFRAIFGSNSLFTEFRIAGRIPNRFLAISIAHEFPRMEVPMIPRPRPARSADVTRICSFLIVLAVLGLNSTAALAQSNLCLIDISKVFKANTQFKEQMAALKAEADQFQIQLQDAQQRLAQMSEELRKLDAAGVEYKTKESEIAQLSAKWEVDRRTKLRELMQRECQLHYDTYAQINSVIGQYCQENQIPLVIRFSNERMNLEDPETIMQAFNNSVVFYAPQRDITEKIIARMADGSTTQTK